MKRISLIIAFSLLVGCGASTSNQVEITGPELSIDQAKSIVVDQLYINGGTEDEYSSNGDFTIYLRDPLREKDVACARKEEGTENLSKQGDYYGNLSVPLVEVDGNIITQFLRFQIVFVEKDSESACPLGIDEENDDIVGVSAVDLKFEDLLGKTIWATNGKAAVVLRDSYFADNLTIPEIVPVFDDALTIDKLYFEDGAQAKSYYISAMSDVGGVETYLCQIEDAKLSGVKVGGIAYSALGVAIPCLTSATVDYKKISVKLKLWAQRDTGDELIAETNARLVGDLIGTKVNFTNGKGFISFAAVVSTPLESNLLRIGDLTRLKASSLSYTPTPWANSELHFIDQTYGYTIACSGADAATSTNFVAAEGQKELFGWQKVKMALIDRKDGLKCPQAPTSESKTLAISDELGNEALKAGAITFLDGKGALTLKISADAGN